MSEEATVPPTANADQARDETRPQRRASLNERPSHTYHLIKVFVWCLGLGLAFLMALYVASVTGLLPSGGKPQEQAPAQGLDPQASSSVPLSIEDATAASELRTKLSLSRTKGRKALGQLAIAEKALSEWDQEELSFQKTAEALQTSDDGKRVAGSEKLLSTFRAVLDEDRPQRETLTALKDTASELKLGFEQSVANPRDVALSDIDIETQVNGLVAKARLGRDGWRGANESVRAIVAKAKAEGKSSTVTLREALEKLRQDEAFQRATAVDAAQTKARDEATRKLAQEKADFEKKQGEQAVLKVTEDKRRMLDQAKREKLLADARNAEIQARFQPYLGKGKYRFVQADTFVAGVYGERLQPASLSILEKSGYLRDVQTFALGMAGRRSNANITEIHNDRPTVPYPTNEAEWQRMEQLYEQFKELAPVWTELGLLEK